MEFVDSVLLSLVAGVVRKLRQTEASAQLVHYECGDTPRELYNYVPPTCTNAQCPTHILQHNTVTHRQGSRV